jgi:hypothetical protein
MMQGRKMSLTRGGLELGMKFRLLVLSLLVSCVNPGATKPISPVTSPVDLVINPAVALGEPASAPISGLQTVTDQFHRVAKHAIPAVAAEAPTAFAGSKTPSIPDLKLLSRRDALIIYLPNVQGAADYRAYAIRNDVTFQGEQPRGAVIACAGYRQRLKAPLKDATGNIQRELLQSLELPGFTTAGEYKIVVEAISSPCDFTGMLGHTDATIPVVQNIFPQANDATINGFATVRAKYGNEILNGQGANTAWLNPNGKRGTPQNATDPTVIARSVVQVKLPFADENTNAPIIDVGPESVFDDFAGDAVATLENNPDHGFDGNASLRGKFADWFFWSNGAQMAVGDGNGLYGTKFRNNGVQVWKRHGRLYSTNGDWAQDVMSAVHFSSTKTKPLELSDTTYAHSFFRVNSDASSRRYWVWMMCGAGSREELVDATNVPRFTPVLDSFFYDPKGTFANSGSGKNPSSRHANEPVTEAGNPNRYDKECLSLVQLGSQFYYGPRPAGSENWLEPASQLRLVLSPKAVTQGIINLAPDGMGDSNPSNPGIWFKLDKDKKYAGPLLEPFDQFAPLTHFDVFVRKDRVVLFINGRQAFCSDFKTRKLESKYMLPIYGNVLYHSSAEYKEQYLDSTPVGSTGLFQYFQNTPIADTRIWDSVGQSQNLEIPALFKFDEGTCFAPKTLTVQ